MFRPKKFELENIYENEMILVIDLKVIGKKHENIGACYETFPTIEKK